ncbi:putative sodium/calcium exchanger 7 [Apis mellifera]|uniref:Sodium/calcium exchanger 7 n=1 Tax=Apis mellifera TaxID=7460 RepID=A0A7M7L0R7_APIME|nr:putative sodium/calcium exchanger 7 [Apis mellifera]|eukprot:XP_026295949.1 putative sodium/calcium exchanger 7 [Apis mellifera]
MVSKLFERYMRHGALPIRQDDCSYVWQIPAENRCNWVRETRDCRTDSLIQYTEILFCTFTTENKPLFAFGLILMVIWLLYLFFILGTSADNFFCPSLAVIATVLRLSDNIAGVTILAFGNGAPDIFTSLVSGADESIIMFTELIGAGIFVTTIIAGSVAVIRPFRVELKFMMRDACFYIVTVFWISFVVRDHRVHLWEAASFILYYCLFILVVVLMQMYENREERLKKRIPSVPDEDILRTYLANKEDDTIPEIPIKSRAAGLRAKLDVAIAVELQRQRLIKKEMEEIIVEEVGRPKGLFREFLYDINPISKEDWQDANAFIKFILIIRAPFMAILQLLIPLVSVTTVKRGWSKLLNCFQLCVTPTFSLFVLNVWAVRIGPITLMPIVLLIGTILGIIVFLITDKDRIPKFHNAFAFFGFFTAMMVVYLVAKEVMAVLQCVGYAFSISDAMLGITLLAWGNSIGDLIANVTIARQGFPRMGYAACFGGPMFNTLLGLGLTYGVEAAKDPNYLTMMRLSDMAPGCLAFLVCSLLTSIIYMNITGSIARKSYGFLLYSIYFSFLIIQFLSELHIIHPLGIDHRPDIDRKGD